VAGRKSIEKVAEVTSEWVATVAASAEQFSRGRGAQKKRRKPESMAETMNIQTDVALIWLHCPTRPLNTDRLRQKRGRAIL
jgi:hypothetical protein